MPRNIFIKIKSIKLEIYILVIIAVFNLLAGFIYFGLPGEAIDYYGDAINYVKGLETPEYSQGIYYRMISRILNSPLMIFSSAWLASTYEGSLRIMLFQNIIFYFLLIYVFYKLVFIIFDNSRIAFWATLFFSGNFCMYNYMPTYSSDPGGWFFLLLSVYFAISYYKKQIDSYYYLCILSSIVGLFYKETGGLGMLSLGVLILFQETSLKEKIRTISKAAILFLIPVVIFHGLIYLFFHYSYFTWYSYLLESDGSVGLENVNRLKDIIKQPFQIFLIGWYSVFYGLYKSKKNLKKEQLIFLIALLPWTLSFLLWSSLIMRIMFVLVPFLAILAGYGLYQIKNNYVRLVIIFSYLVSNYYIFPILATLGKYY